MHQPGARVVGLEGNSHVSVRRQEDYVPSGRVDKVERVEAGGGVESRVALRQQHDVHAVPVERVRNLIAESRQRLSLGLFGGIKLVETGMHLLWMMLVFAGRGIEVSFEASMTIKI